MEFQEIRATAVSAIASHDELCDSLVLKGGNALELIYKIGNRSSLDLDFSLSGDVDDIEILKRQLDSCILDRFDSKGYIVFDTSLEFKPRPKVGDVPEWWGGYSYKFKIIPRNEYMSLEGNLEKLRRQATEIGARHERSFEIQISRSEYCEGSTKIDIDGFPLRVYTTAMIGCEKLRAICQQSKYYTFGQGGPRAPRARDFYDIYMLAEQGGVDFSDRATWELLKAMFGAKRVPLHLLAVIREDKEFHRQDWQKVQQAVRGPLEEYDFYFDYVTKLVGALESLWVIDSP